MMQNRGGLIIALLLLAIATLTLGGCAVVTVVE